MLKCSFSWICIALLFTACQRDASQVSEEEGRAMATKYCGNCHLTPDPSLLDKSTWREHVLPAMAEQLGVEVLEGNMYLHSKQSAISSPDWQKLLKYYETLAPDSLSAPERNTPVPLEKPLFSIKKPLEDSATASTMLVKFDPANRDLLVGSAANTMLWSYSQTFEKKRIAKLASPAVHLHLPGENDNNYIVTAMGGMRALDITKGQITAFTAKRQPASLAFPADLIRPIDTKAADFNKDGLTDYLICSFGHHLGGLYILKQRPGQQYEKVAVKEVPGATHSYIRDFNQDGWPDIMALFAHADEGIRLFLNNQKGGFSEKLLLRFPPVFGSSSFELVDMNHDGLDDIVYTAGDNSDYSRILKPYHGLYIFTNTGDFTFKQTFFYPINGCTKAVAADFDQDGNTEIATIAFFADLKNRSYEKFLYFRQDAARKNNYIPATLPLTDLGRWICMDAADWDGDGDIDVVLGNFSRGFLNQDQVETNWNANLPFVVLENNSAR